MTFSFNPFEISRYDEKGKKMIAIVQDLSDPDLEGNRFPDRIVLTVEQLPHFMDVLQRLAESEPEKIGEPTRAPAK